MEFSHIPVLLEQAVDALAVKENGIYVDGTAGGGGHSSEILSRLTTGKLISIDQDPDAILTLTERFKKNENSIIIKGNFAEQEWAGACFSADGKWMFVNIQSPGITLAITGPWEQGAL